MASSKMQAPSSNHLVNKFSANGLFARIFRCIIRKSAESAFTENLLPGYWTKNPAFHAVLVIISIFRMNFTETNRQSPINTFVIIKQIFVSMVTLSS